MKIRKPMRLEEKLVAMVEKHGDGDSFTAKMEYVLNDYFNSLPTIKQEYKRYEEMIVNSKKEQERIRANIDNVQKQFDDFMWNLRTAMR